MKRPQIMGILNVTPDSFSGDGLLGRDPLSAAAQLAQAGAQVIDIGAESTRPGAAALDAAAEWSRLGPLLESLARQPWRSGVRLSVDTRHAATAARALEAGVDLINDVTALGSPALMQVLREHRCDVVVMHALSVPVDPARTLPADCDVVQELLRWKAALSMLAQEYGVAAERLIFDPGIGFGKTARQSLALVQRADELVASGGRWLVGHSRKSFLQLFTAAPASARDDLTLALSAHLARCGVEFLRVHAVARHATLFGSLFDAPAPLFPTARTHP